MKRIFQVIVMCMGFTTLNAQVAEKTFAELKNEGNAAVGAKDYQKALDLYEHALVKWGDKPIADTSMIYNMGYCAYSAKNYDKALKYFEQSYSMNYKKVNSLVYKADSYKAMKNDAENLKALETALSIAPDDAKVKTKMASYYVKAATSVYSKGSTIITKANSDIAAGKLKTSDAAYIASEKKAKDEYKKALPLIEKAMSFDPANATAKQLKDACDQALKQ
ncbi:MAG: tetratricopeptide repeat protein [Verrucomicrobia bacterium]|nr:tetratricopeptide repeat protein [Prolixibacteraceae bacterium]